MELKVVCNCGQKYKFDVEPVNRQMPFVVNCPVCGEDGTNTANAILAQIPPPPMSAAATAVAAPAALQMNRPAIAPPAPRAAPAPAGRPTPSANVPAVPKYLQTNKATQNNSFLLGTVGALLGAVVAVGFMVGTHIFLGFSFPLFGTVMGAIIGFGARLFYRGTDSTLGAMSAVVAFITIGATLLLMFGILGILFSVMALMIGVGAAWGIASG